MDLPKDHYNKLFQMKASRSSLLIVNGSGAVLGSVLIYFLMVQRLIFNPIAFGVAVGLLLLYLLLDYLQWNKSGIRMIEVDQQGVKLYRGEKMELTSIKATEIKEVNVFGKVNRRVVNIILEGGSKNEIIPGLITTFKGPRERITNDAFDDDHFELFITLLRRMSV